MRPCRAYDARMYIHPAIIVFAAFGAIIIASAAYYKHSAREIANVLVFVAVCTFCVYLYLG